MGNRSLSDEKGSEVSRILVDVDGVLADFHTEFLRMLSYTTGRHVRPEQVTDFDFLSVATTQELKLTWANVDNTEKWCYSLPPFKGIGRALFELRKTHEVIAVTAPRFGKYWMCERAQWLFDHGFDEDTVIFTAAKQCISGDVFIDDRLENIQSWCSHNRHGWGFLVDRSWNQGDAAGQNWQRVPDLKTAVDLIRDRG